VDIGVGGCVVVPDQLSRSMRERYTVGHKHQEQRRTETLPQRVDTNFCGPTSIILLTRAVAEVDRTGSH